MLITMGWFVTSPRAHGAAARNQQIVPKGRRPVIVPTPTPLEPSPKPALVALPRREAEPTPF
jgi:hypothetical protein